MLSIIVVAILFVITGLTPLNKSNVFPMYNIRFVDTPIFNSFFEVKMFRNIYTQYSRKLCEQLLKKQMKLCRALCLTICIFGSFRLSLLLFLKISYILITTSTTTSYILPRNVITLPYAANGDTSKASQFNFARTKKYSFNISPEN